ncbi:type III pantothenate kinase [Haoranjiania flava]|uniref:Type III pantothenate kinase n=1 Tax=Haoranjiania flava TaxID=1856322 RepID=A0AAE3ILW3_9BACT|nr:type III pantothenate kinase [Haoranjiania flava]MCU7693350.1 type III pantothenate kinase [Haoranjiania flava]
MNLFGAPSNTLCLDFGNSRYKCGIMSKDQLVEERVLGDDMLADLHNIVDEFKPKYSILSSVIDHDKEVEELLKQTTSFHLVTHESNLPIHVPSRTVAPSVGADRWAMLMGAVARFPKQHNLVIGLGSCITFNFINKFSEFLGGSISPGLYMRMKSMNQFTAKLPLVEPEWNFPLIGYDTKTNIQSGVILGISKEIDGIIDLYKEKYTKFNVLLTGGDASFFLPHLKNRIFADPHLIYKGLYAISKINSK